VLTSQTVVQADSMSGRYNLSSVVSYSKGFEIVMSLIRLLVIWLCLSINPPRPLRPHHQPSDFPMMDDDE
jgi:hypothetical protein